MKTIVLLGAVTTLGFQLYSASVAEAGALGRQLWRETAERVTGRQVLEVSEREALERILRECDTDALRALQARFGKHIPDEALQYAQQHPTVFLKHSSYQQWLRQAYPNASWKEFDGVVGDTHPITNTATIDRNQPLMVRVVSHERAHQLSHKGFGQRLGRDFDEGATDYFAAQVSSDLRIPEIGVGYPPERELVGMLTARVGDDALASAYFRGEFEALARSLDSDLGAGTFASLQRHLRSGDLDAARALLLGKGR